MVHAIERYIRKAQPHHRIGGKRSGVGTRIMLPRFVLPCQHLIPLQQ